MRTTRTFRALHKLLLVAAVLVATQTTWAQAAPTGSATPSPTEERLRILEKKLKELEQREVEVFDRSVEERGRVKTFLNDSIAFGGFFESAVTGVTGVDTTPQVSAHSNTLGLNITAQFNERTRFVSQLLAGLAYTFPNPHNDSRGTPAQRQFGSPFAAALVAQAYSEMTFSDSYILQFGLGYVPFGTAFQQREPVLFRRRGGPTMLQSGSASSVGIAHPLWMGVNVHGSKAFTSSRVGYSAYTHSPTTDTKTLGLGGRVWSTISDDTTYGFSVQNGSMTGGSYTSMGVDFDRHAPWGGFVAEYAKNTRSDGTKLAESYYVEPYIHLDDSKVVAFVAADHLDNPFNTTAPALSDPIKKWVYGGGLNWLPIPFARFRLGYFQHRYEGSTATSGAQKRDFETYEISSGIAF
ncbi:MAG: hypothetical protein V4760_11050 [Bdellovibrionota bacterium]